MKYITYTDNKPALIQWLTDNSDIRGVTLVEGEPKLTFDKIPTFTSGLHSISLLMLDDASVLSGALAAGVFEILATGNNSFDMWNEVINDVDLKAKMDLAYPRTIQTGTDLEGWDWTYQPPEIPAVFSGETP